MAKAKKGLLDTFERAFRSIEEEVFEVTEEKTITESQQSSNFKGVLRQSMNGKGYEILVRKDKGKPARIIISSDADVMVTVNGKDIEPD